MNDFVRYCWPLLTILMTVLEKPHGFTIPNNYLTDQALSELDDAEFRHGSWFQISAWAVCLLHNT